MEIQVLTEFQLEMTLIGEAIVEKVFLPKIWPSLAQMLSKISKFEIISEFSDLYHGNTHNERVSYQNDHDWWWYFPKCNFAPNLTHVWPKFCPK